ncbi:MAG: hypothetical protein KME49_17650 [Brasilonema octagenarum HA4186-MV1]|jgi:hypothetical protein|nr:MULTISPECIES: hypothetical protein [Brasilonema]MBW4627274.1 hypothetical protein [Brasilonema octagenarum HA4186-MV1]
MFWKDVLTAIIFDYGGSFLSELGNAEVIDSLPATALLNPHFDCIDLNTA